MLGAGDFSGDIRQAYVRKFALAYSLTTLAFSLYFTPQEFNPKSAIPVNIGLFLIAAPHWFRNSKIPAYWLNVISQVANAGASVWICSFLGPTSHINLVAIPQFIMALMMFSGIHPKTTIAVAGLCLLQLMLPLFPFVDTWYLHKRMREPGLVVLRAILDVTIFSLSTYQFKIISESWNRLVARAEDEKALYQNRNEWRKKLLRILSHDIKEPMVHSLLAARNLKKKVSGDEASIVNQIESAQISIREMITNVELSNQELDMGTSGQVKAPVVAHSVQGVIEKLGPWFESRLKEKQVVLDLSGAAGEHLIQAAGDAFVYQVFMNLLSNAVKFTPRGGVVRIESRAWPDGDVAWMIRDAGVGIGPEVFVAHTTPQPGTDGERGSGLGLKIARTFAEDNGIELVFLSPRLGVRHPRVEWEGPGTCVVLLQKAQAGQLSSAQ
jgi:signal transduction histidine kinase